MKIDEVCDAYNVKIVVLKQPCFLQRFHPGIYL